jgi:Flp pilus assembly protein TadG
MEAHPAPEARVFPKEDMKMSRFRQRISRTARSERGDANIIEYAIVFPICLLVFFFLFMIGFMLNQYALLESAAERGILIAQKAFTDTNAELIMDYDAMAGRTTAGFSPVSEPDYDKFTNDPYRFFGTNYKESTIKAAVSDTVKEIIRNNQLLGNTFLGDTTVDYTSTGGLLNKTATVTVEQEFKPLRMVARVLNLSGDTFTIKASAIMKIRSQTEFLRNTDFVCDLAVRFGLDQYVQKITGFFQKITDFFNKT